MEVGVLGKVTQLLIKHAQALTRHLVRLNVVNTNLQIVESRFVQSFDSFGREVIAIGDQAGDHSMRADVMNDVVELRMHHGLAARNRDNRGSERSQLVYATLDQLDRHWRRGVVILVAIAASQIAPAHGDQVGQHRMARGDQGAANETELPELLLDEFRFSHYGNLKPAEPTDRVIREFDVEE